MLLLHLLLCQYESICPFIGLRWIFFPLFLPPSNRPPHLFHLHQEYMVYRKHTYMRLDGSSKISERRDMVADFQSRWVEGVKERESVSNYHLEKNCTTLHPFSLFHFKTVSEHAELNKGFFCSHFLSFLSCRTDIFVFLLSTRAGGLGINLTAADTVSLFAVKNQYD